MIDSKRTPAVLVRAARLAPAFAFLTLALLLLLIQSASKPSSSFMMAMSTPPQAQSTAFAFVTNSGSGTVSAFTVGSTGSLSPVAGSPFASGDGAEFMALDKVHNFLFVANQFANNVSAFLVNTGTGMLSPAPGSPFAAGTKPLGMAVDAAGRFLFVANQNGNSVSVFSINAANGALSQVAGSPFTGVPSPFGVAVDPSGAFLFVSNFNGDSGIGNTISTFSINSATGALSPAGPALATSSPAGITAPIGIATDGRFLFVGNHMAESVVSFSINNSNGALTATSSLPPPAGACAVSCHHNPLRLAVHPTDKFIYWTNVQAGTLSAFNINNGNLALISEAAAGQHPFGLALDPSGMLLYVVNKVDNTISGFSVNPSTGMVSPIAGSPFAEGGNDPTDIVIVGKH
jgi:6-phosphogluconolactonase (cycloisomerase 2 family)